MSLENMHSIIQTRSDLQEFSPNTAMMEIQDFQLSGKHSRERHYRYTTHDSSLPKEQRGGLTVAQMQQGKDSFPIKI